MPSEFYTSIIEEEKKKFEITNESLKIAARVISSSYSERSLKKGSTHLDYNNPECRCAYVYKYADLHAGMVTKYFRKFIKKKEIRNHFQRGIKICSLGGGPGTDIIGIFKALSVIPYFQQRLSRVSVLDICGGWSNTFENIISGLLTGKVNDVSKTLVCGKKFKHELIEVDLLQSLPEDVVEIISKADVICMVKFMSVVLARKGCSDALKVLGNLFKPGAIVLFIDNYKGNVFESTKDILNQTGHEIVLGPLHEVYVKHTHKQNKEIYGCLAQTAARISVVGMIKRETKNVLKIFSLRNGSYSSWCKQDSVSSEDEYNEDENDEDENGEDENDEDENDEDENGEDENDEDEYNEEEYDEDENDEDEYKYEDAEPIPNTYKCDKYVQTELEDCSKYKFEDSESILNTYKCDKYVQTELEDCSKFFDNSTQQASLHCEIEELTALMGTFLDLFEVIEKEKNTNIQPKHICCCHCH